jgi:tetratricopeptide (TPR) repeat protein
LPGWQKLYEELRNKNFEIVSVAEDSAGIKAAGPRITASKLDYTVLIDESHLVTRLYDLVNVPMGVWVNEKGRIVRPPEVAYVDNRFKVFHNIEAEPYLEAIRDWVNKGDKSRYALTEKELREQLAPQNPDHAIAAAEFALGEYLHNVGHGEDAIPHFKEAQRLNPDSWNYKRQAWSLSDSKRDYGTTFGEEVRKLGGKPYYKPRVLERDKRQQ